MAKAQKRATPEIEKDGLLTDEDMRPENIKCTISIRITADVLDGYRARAKTLGIGYQTLMQLKLREALERDDLESRIKALEIKTRGLK